MGKRKGSKKPSKPSPPPSLAGKSKTAAAPPPSAPKAVGPPPKAVVPNHLLAEILKQTADADSSAPRVRLFNRPRPPVGPPPKAVVPHHLLAEILKQTADANSSAPRVGLFNRRRAAEILKQTADANSSAPPRVRLFNPPVGPPPKAVFPNYPSAGSSTATPLPPPGMPKHRFLRRFLPLILAANLAVGGYVLLSTPKKQLFEKDVDVAAEVPCIQVESIEATNS